MCADRNELIGYQSQTAVSTTEVKCELLISFEFNQSIGSSKQVSKILLYNKP
jgi:hypothetical protein